ncbi:hypothetical protein E3N88_46276 [Mikania micrantha]|uniref:Uncharacterized protein n=1 Tax=Mikania micrantha TaxID=192012 RepID=A0A5N6L7G3_9ASTR|nr:hypothetical protein E3N88_46276 [Mikania micrantha]
MVETSSSSYSGRGGGCMLSYHQSPTISSEEEEDMANCLIMLAHSVSPVNKDKPESDIFCQKTKRLKTRSVTEMAATTVEGNSSDGGVRVCDSNRVVWSMKLSKCVEKDKMSWEWNE